MKLRSLLLLLPIIVLAASCDKEVGPPEPQTEAKLIFKFKFDTTQERLNNVGQPSTIPAGFAAQNPVMNTMSAHYIELAPSATTALGSGAILYRAEETSLGGAAAIDFEKAKFAANDSTFIAIPIKAIPAGEYEWIRTSLAYQNATIKFLIDTVINTIPIKQEFDGTIAGFIGFNTYIKSVKIKDSLLAVNANKKQGFWAFETTPTFGPFTFTYATSGQAPEGATTVVNPIFNTSPVPAGSCVVTGAFTPGKLVITGKETQDIIVELSFSINKSFEWQEVVVDGKWEPSKGEQVADMGIRGMIPKIK